MRIVYDPEHRRHRPRTEILYGKPIPNPDQPERVEAIRQAIAESQWEPVVVGPWAYPLDLAERVHEPEYVVHLRERCADAAAGVDGLDGEWFPYVWPRDRSMDTGTPLQEATLDLAWASACVALTGADLILEGEAAVFALCRPPGHHASRGAMGGYCYFNNAALAADRLLNQVQSVKCKMQSDVACTFNLGLGIERDHESIGKRQGSGVRSVAILDVDIHHGNGTQDIFYESDRVLYCSIHGEPDWAYPPHTGFAEEQGAGAGAGFTYNQPLPEGTAWPAYAVALERALERIARFDPAHVVLSQGFDTSEGDRWGGFLLRAEHYTRIAERVRTLGVPILAILEGGYEPAHLAAGSLALLEGLQTD